MGIDNLDSDLRVGDKKPENFAAPETGKQPEGSLLVEKLRENPITLIPKEDVLTLEKIHDHAPGAEQIYFCDGKVKGIEKWERKGSEFFNGNVFVFDHHQELPEMSRNVSTTNFVIDYVRRNKDKPINRNDTVMIHHTDCDSVLSSAISRRILGEPLDRFGEAAIAADHTGAENPIADLLQAIENERDMEFSLRNLELHLANKPLEERAQKMLEARKNKREELKAKVDEYEKHKKETGKDWLEGEREKIGRVGSVFAIETYEKIDGGLLPALVPDAAVVLIFCPKFDEHKKNCQKWKQKLD